MSKKILISVSSIVDGSMSKAVDDTVRLANRQAFLASHTVSPDKTILVHLTYEGSDYCRYHTVSAGHAGDGILTESSVIADALFTRTKGLALLLPVADCIGAVLYDPQKQVLGLAHLGRHNLLQKGGTGIIEYMSAEFGSDPSDITVWLSPAAGRENYPLYDFENRSMHDVAIEQLSSAGILPSNIDRDMRDTTKDNNLFSHSEFLKGNRSSDGRQAVVCMMRP